MALYTSVVIIATSEIEIEISTQINVYHCNVVWLEINDENGVTEKYVVHFFLNYRLYNNVSNVEEDSLLNFEYLVCVSLLRYISPEFCKHIQA